MNKMKKRIYILALAATIASIAQPMHANIITTLKSMISAPFGVAKDHPIITTIGAIVAIGSYYWWWQSRPVKQPIATRAQLEKVWAKFPPITQMNDMIPQLQSRKQFHDFFESHLSAHIDAIAPTIMERLANKCHAIRTAPGNGLPHQQIKALQDELAKIINEFSAEATALRQQLDKQKLNAKK